MKLFAATDGSLAMMRRRWSWLLSCVALIACEASQGTLGRPAAAQADNLGPTSAVQPNAVQPNAVQPVGSTQTLELLVEGTNCASCSVEIRRELRRLPGIVDVRQGENKRHLLVEFQAEAVQPLRILEAVNAAGYEAEMLVQG